MHAPEAILAIVGPTASGKTDLALHLAKSQNAELISVDSRQVYRHLLVGTAKPRGRWEKKNYIVEGIPYHLLDILEPDQIFSAAMFVQKAQDAIAEIKGRGRTPIFVGGTGLYFKALTEGLADLPPASPDIRKRLKQVAEAKGRDALHEKLAKIDATAAKAIPANNIQRLVRALEVYELTGKPISQWHREHKKSGLAMTFRGIDLPNEELRKRIEARCEAMLEGGIVEETQALLKQGYSKTCPALSGLGYPRILAYLDKQISRAECLRLVRQDTRQYAKRQMTWFRHQLPVIWNAF